MKYVAYVSYVAYEWPPSSPPLTTSQHFKTAQKCSKMHNATPESPRCGLDSWTKDGQKWTFRNCEIAMKLRWNCENASPVRIYNLAQLLHRFTFSHFYISCLNVYGLSNLIHLRPLHSSHSFIMSLFQFLQQSNSPLRGGGYHLENTAIPCTMRIAPSRRVNAYFTGK